MSVVLTIETADELRDALPVSGVFEMSDCSVLIDYPVSTTVADLSRITTILESVIHVVDMEMGMFTDSSNFQVIITEVPIDIAEGRRKFKRID